MTLANSLKILIVEDHSDISHNIADYFQLHGAVTDFAINGEQAIELALGEYYDCIVLDIMLPKSNGLEVCSAIRANATRHIPIIMLTARDTLEDKLIGFNMGADDYLTKPFALEELWARCNALSQRHLLNCTHTLQVGPVSLNKQTQQVVRDGQAIMLQPIPLQILTILLEAYPRAVSRSELCDKIWGDEHTDSDALRSHVYQLRKVLDRPFDKPVIKTLHGVGFALDSL
ncbi:response regulator transcription factor [Pseudoalteromonas sp. MMG013]|uniref:response regulator transcription factor n=1 Tax=unclassified Pseudoalteromonas TaxID=194690 RepID=UPI001B3815C5|nr:response regulator transcription factor [Pseudoalteromonas sp. MMG012]MBQ4852819.1 response regulator transcription factor [Pseudoalteromonas sp. MMG012]MBQ4863882.1 response regulator transcription factor [Pseudoalteromonas sp. MMG013]